MERSLRHLVFLSSLVLALTPLAQATAQPFFTNITDQVGLGDFVFDAPPTSVVFVDYNNDGFQDVFFTEILTRRMGLFQNSGDGRLIDMTSAIPSELHTVSRWGILADYDNDGDEDLYLGLSPPHGNLLLRNDRGLFSQVTWNAEATPSFISIEAIWLDYDRDGSWTSTSTTTSATRCEANDCFATTVRASLSIARQRRVWTACFIPSRAVLSAAPPPATSTTTAGPTSILASAPAPF